MAARSSNVRRSWSERARIVLLNTEGLSAASLAQRLGFSRRTVYQWRERFIEAGVKGLCDRPRPGQPKRLKPAKAKKILDLTTKRLPKESTHWSTRLIAKYAGVTQWQVRQVWLATDLRPHSQTIKISKDPKFAEKVIEVVGLYLNPPEDAVALSVDEKTQVQALDRKQPMLPLRPCRIESRSHDYKRNGTASLYAAFDIATGKEVRRITKKHRAREFIAFLRQGDQTVEPDLDLHLIIDNSSTHKTGEVKDFLAGHPRIHFHFTPTSASWLNAVETWFSQVGTTHTASKCLRQRTPK